MHKLLSLSLLGLLAGCDSATSALESDPTGPEAITYRIVTANSEPLVGATWAESVVTPTIDLRGPLASPWEITIPYYIGMKSVYTQLPSDTGATVAILIDGEVISENVFPSRNEHTLVGAVAGLPNYTLHYVAASNIPATKYFVVRDGVDLEWIDTYRFTYEPDETANVWTTLGIGDLPSTIAFQKTGEGILGVSLRHLGAAVHLVSVGGPEPFEMSFTFNYDGR
jgi:hypothetical protein